MNRTEWVAVDWSSLSVRAWGVARGGKQTFFESLPLGTGRISQGDYPGILHDLIAGRLEAGEVLVCGMAGSKQGWREVPYLETPAPLGLLREAALSPGRRIEPFDVRIVPGLCQRVPGREDVMRGEEVRLLGLTSLHPDYSGAVVQPNFTHSKWADIHDGAVTRFCSVMTGEVLDLLSTHSVLRHSIGQAHDAGEHHQGVEEGLDRGVEAPARILSLAFRTRSAALLSRRHPAWCAGYLRGLLVGAEVATNQNWLQAAPTPIVGPPALTGFYARALARLGHASVEINEVDAAILGLASCRVGVRA